MLLSPSQSVSLGFCSCSLSVDMGLCKRFVSTWCSLITYFIGTQKKKHVADHLCIGLPPAGEEGILFAPQCCRSNPTGVDNTRGVRRWLRALGWSSGSRTCSAAAVTPACTCAPRRSSASPPHQALGITSIGTDTLPMATSNLFKALEAECWLRGLPWLTGFTPFIH